MPVRHELRIRYSEVDMQQVAFNAHYLTYVDEACNTLFRDKMGEGYLDGTWDMVLKRAELTWHGSAGFEDLLAIDVAVRRWGTTSFDVGFEGSVGGEPVFEATVTYVSVDPVDRQPTPVPEKLRAALS